MWHTSSVTPSAFPAAARLDRAFTRAEAAFFAGRRRSDSGRRDLAEARRFVSQARHSLAVLNDAVPQPAPVGVLLLEAFPAYLLATRDRHLAFRMLAARWSELAGGSVSGAEVETEAETLRAALAEVEPPTLAEALATYQLAVAEALRKDLGRERAQVALRSFMAHLDLSFDQLGRMFGVSGETVRRWERGTHPVPEGRLAQLTASEAALGRLLEIFQPEALPRVVRRHAELFEGDTPLDWILRGRIREVADRYEALFSFQARA